MAPKKKPTKIALISDIHGNLPALEAVLGDAARRGAQTTWNLGDMLGYAPFPNEVLEALQEAGAVNIVGNYDLKVLDFERKREKWKRRKAPAKFIAFQWNDAHLRHDSRVLLTSLARQVRCTVNGVEALLVHGSPASIDELLNSNTQAQRLEELAEMAEADLVVCGHSHDPFVRRIGKTCFVNPGSVGRPEGGDGRASYAILTIADGEVKVAHRRVPYDIERVVRAVHAAGLPKDYIDVFRQAKSLDQLWRDDDPSGIRPKGPSDKTLEAVLALAESCQYEREHTHQVTRLALEIFDGLKDLHRMGPQKRLWLQCGALLHDIGWTTGQGGHHKAALRVIMAAAELPLERREREIVGLIARYHRRALPRPDHKYYGNLSGADQHCVRVLGGILRVADGLDRTHSHVVQAVRCKVSDREIALIGSVQAGADAEVAGARKKADLLAQVFNRPVAISVRRRSR